MARDDPSLEWAGDLGRMAQVSILAYLVAGSFLSLSYWDFYWTLLVVLGMAQGLAMAAPVAVPRIATGWRARVA